MNAQFLKGALNGCAIGVAACLTAVFAFQRGGTETMAAEVGNPDELVWIHADAQQALPQIERQLRGFDTTMAEVGYRFTELYFAGQDRNWPYAEYQLEKLEHTIRLGLERRPKRAASAEEFLNSALPAVTDMVKRHDTETFTGAMERLRSECMKCHVAENVPHFTVHLPEHPAAPLHPSHIENGLDEIPF